MLVAALLGIGLSALLLRNLAHTAPRKALPLIIACIVAGTLLADVLDFVISSKSGHPTLPSFTQLIAVGFIVLAVTLRLRQSAAR